MFLCGSTTCWQTTHRSNVACGCGPPQAGQAPVSTAHWSAPHAPGKASARCPSAPGRGWTLPQHGTEGLFCPFWGRPTGNGDPKCITTANAWNFCNLANSYMRPSLSNPPPHWGSRSADCDCEEVGHSYCGTAIAWQRKAAIPVSRSTRFRGRSG